MGKSLAGPKLALNGLEFVK